MMKSLFASLILTLLTSTLAWGKTTTLKALRVEYATTPLGIDVAQPRFSWQMVSDERATAQTAYQIKVSDAKGRKVWDTSRRLSSIAQNIRYEGESLQPRTRYQWTVTVWDNHGQQLNEHSWFETGLMTTSDRDPRWGGARWIGGTDSTALTFYPHYLPVFRLRFAIALDRSTRTREAAIIYGANDVRLMDRNKNILGMACARNTSFIEVALNTSGLDRGDSASVDFYRVGYTQHDTADKPMASFKVPTSLINKQNRYLPHHFELASMHGTTRLWVDGEEKPLVSDLNLNPMGKGGDYISFPNVGDMGFDVARGAKATFSGIEVLNYRLPRHTLCRIADATVTGERRFFAVKETGAPMLRTEFAAPKTIARARLYATARGTYDFYVNGKRVADDYLNPGLTQYNKTQFYQTYDVTSLLRQGDNAIGAQLNEGWWSGAISFSGDNWNYFGDKQSLLAELVITFTDGSEQRVVTRPETWKLSTDGPVRLGSIFQGEIYDATREKAVRGWTEPGFNDQGWTAAAEVPLEGTISHELMGGFFGWPCADDYRHFQLTAQQGMPVRPFTVLTAQSVNEVRPGVYVYDMGQNMAGVPSITFAGLKSGQKVMMRYAEVLYPDLPEYKGNVGMVMMENQRGAMEQDIYVARGGNETFSPRSTYHGYRYVEITGIDSSLPLSAVKGVVLSSVDELASAFTTSDKDLNRFFKNVEWSSLANIFSVPTDCPQRNERMGWSGDLSVFSPTMSYMFNGAQFLRRHLRALRDTQGEDGYFASIAPIGGGFGGPLWASVGIAVPWQSYVQYGDVEALREHYGAMKRYMELQLTKYIDPVEHYYKGTGMPISDLGDWLGFEVQKNDNSLLFDCYLCYELQIMQQVARILGHDADAQHFSNALKTRRNFINGNYIDAPTGRTVGPGLGKQHPATFGGMDGPKRKGELIDTQTSYALLLAFGLVRDEMKQKVTQQFINSITRQSVGDDGKVYPEYSLMTGFIGTAWIAKALTNAGRSDVAYRMLLNRKFPSWLYPVTQGATSIWERLNSYTKTNGFGGNNNMNSFNHYAFGSVTSWLMQHVLGIDRDEQSPAFKHFVLTPVPDVTGQLSFAKGHYDSMYGRIESGWERRTGTKAGTTVTAFHFVIPANTSATVVLPAKSLKTVKESGVALKKLRGIKPELQPNGTLCMELPSGKYDFTVTE